MNPNEKWNRTRLTLMATLAAIVLFAGTPIGHAQMQAPDTHGDDYEIELDGEGFGDSDAFDGGPLAMHGGMRGGMRGRHAGMMEKLNLSDRQKDQMADLRDTQERKMIGIKSGLAEARLDMRKLMRADNPSQSQIDATIDRTAKLRADAAKARVATRLAMRGLLTDAQKKTMDEMRRGKMRGAEGAPRKSGRPGSEKRGA